MRPRFRKDGSLSETFCVLVLAAARVKKAAADAPPVPTYRPHDDLFVQSHLRDNSPSVPTHQAYTGSEDTEMRLDTPDGNSGLGTPGLTDATPSPSPRPMPGRPRQPRLVEPEAHNRQARHEPNFIESWEHFVNYGEPTTY